MFQNLRHLTLAATCALLLTACGDDSSGGGGSAGVGGAESPQALVDQAAEIAKSKSLDQLIPLVLPAHRGMMTYFMGVIGPSMAIGMMESLGGAVGDDESKAKLDKMKKEWDEVLAKHGVSLPKEDDSMAKMMAMGPDGDKSAMAAQIDKLIGQIDHAAFIRDSMAFLDRNSDKDKPEVGGLFKEFDASKAKIQQDGDSATITVPDQSKPMVLKKSGGRWYIDLVSMM